MRLRNLVMLTMAGMISTTNDSKGAPLDEFRWKSRVLVVVAPSGDVAAREQRKIYNSSAKGMSERSIVLTEAVGESEHSRQIRSRLSTTGKRFQVFLVGKDGHTAISSDKPMSAEYLFARVDAMPMRQEEMRRAR